MSNMNTTETTTVSLGPMKATLMNHYVAVRKTTDFGTSYWVTGSGVDGRLRPAQARAASLRDRGQVAVVHSVKVR